MFYQNIKHCFSSAYCKSLIKEAEAIGFKKAMINDGGTLKHNNSIRNNSKIEFFNQDLANNIEEFVPKVHNFSKLTRVGDFFRVYKYEVGQYFKPHRDGHVELNGEESQLTVLIYLNTCSNAETIIMPYGYSQKWAHVEIPCEEASVLIFDHDLWHSGKLIEQGVKYVLRTDVFYQS